MRLFDRYIFRQLLIATIFIAVILAAVILLTQSMRFLELVIDAGASGFMFWVLTFLALPRFFEVLLPVSLMAATVFVYNKMLIDSEIVVMRGAGASPLSLARPALYLSFFITALLLVMTMWLAPLSHASMQHTRQVVKAQYSALLFREGVFNRAGDGLTVYVRDRLPGGELQGLMIHDSRDKAAPPVTIMAKKGVIVSTDEGQRVVVFEGARQDFNNKNGTLNRLAFDRYTIDLPDDSGSVRQRWPEPDERTFRELLSPDPDSARDRESKRDFMVEAHRRVISPLLAPAFCVIALSFLLLGPVKRGGYGRRISFAMIGVIVIQGLYLGAYNMSRQSDWGLVIMYLLVLLPLAAGLFSLSAHGETLRQRFLYRRKGQAA